MIDLTGRRYDRWIVLSPAEDRIQPSGQKAIMWNCRCDCGTEKAINGGSLRSGISRSCGCLNRELSAQRGRDRRGTSFIYGIAVNDADYDTENCPIYRIWRSMLDRCYGDSDKHPGYRTCTVDPDFLFFSVFREWTLKQGNIDGLVLDKDLIQNPTLYGKVYNSENCCFITQEVNNILGHGGSGKYPQGVRKRGKKYRAVIKISGKQKHLGTYSTVAEAERAYRLAKASLLVDTAIEQKDPRISAGLLHHAARFKYSLAECMSSWAMYGASA